MSTSSTDLEFERSLHHDDRFADVPKTWAGGRYRWVRHLSEGGQGYVELARDTWSNALVVVKGLWWGGSHRLESDYAVTVYEARHEAVQEAVWVQGALGEITHGVPALIDVVVGPSPTRHIRGQLVRGTDQKLVDKYNSETFIVMQFIGDPVQGEARTLASLVEESGQLTDAEAIDLADQISATLEAMHTARVLDAAPGARGRWIHGDIKPDNILVAGDPRRYSLVDLSSAKLVPTGARTDPTEFTPGYAPPSGETLSPRYDLYSLAATLLFALTGNHPEAWLGRATQDSQASTASSSAAAGGEAREPHLRRLRHQLAVERRVHPMLIRLITDCLPSDPGRRLRDAAVLRAEIAAVRTALAAREVLAGLEQRT